MTITKAELEAINRRLHEAVRILADENLQLHIETQQLTAALAASDTRIAWLTRRYARLTAYVKRLHAWLIRNAGDDRGDM